MAAGSSADISAVLTTATGPELYRQWQRLANTSTYAITLKEGMFKEVFFAASGSGGSVTTVQEGAPAPTADNDDTVIITLPRAYYSGSFSVTDSEIAQAERSPMSPQVLENLVGERLYEKATLLWKRINKDVLQGTGTDGATSFASITGFEGALGTSGTYGGQTKTYLASNITGNDSSPAALTTAQLDLDLVGIYVSCGTYPDFIVMHPYVHLKYKGLLDGIRQINSINGQLFPTQGQGADPLDRNRVVSFFNNIPVLVDTDGYVNGTPGSGFGHIYYIKKDFAKLNVLPYRPRLDDLANFNMPAVNSDGEIDERVPFMFNCYKLGRTGSFTTYALQVELQLEINRPNAFGIRKGVTI